MSRARRVFSRSADRAASLPPCPQSLSVRADACDDDAQRVVCDPHPALQLHRRTEIDGARRRPTISPQKTTRSRACVHQTTHARGPDARLPVVRRGFCWGAARRASYLPRGLRGAGLAAQGAGRVARPTLTHTPRAAPPHLFVHVYFCSCINCCRCSSARGTRLLPCLEMDSTIIVRA